MHILSFSEAKNASNNALVCFNAGVEQGIVLEREPDGGIVSDRVFDRAVFYPVAMVLPPMLKEPKGEIILPSGDWAYIPYVRNLEGKFIKTINYVSVEFVFEFETLSVNDFVRSAIANTEAEYLESILTRKSGSTWVEEFKNTEDFASRNWKEIFPERKFRVQGCRYFQAHIKGIQRIQFLYDFHYKELGVINKEQTKNGHGWNLVSESITEEKTPYTTLIIGNCNTDTPVVFTAYPGMLTASLNFIFANEDLENMSVVDLWGYAKSDNLPIIVKKI